MEAVYDIARYPNIQSACIIGINQFGWHIYLKCVFNYFTYILQYNLCIHFHKWYWFLILFLCYLYLVSVSLFNEINLKFLVFSFFFSIAERVECVLFLLLFQLIWFSFQYSLWILCEKICFRPIAQLSERPNVLLHDLWWKYEEFIWLKFTDLQYLHFICNMCIIL